MIKMIAIQRYALLTSFSIESSALIPFCIELVRPRKRKCPGHSNPGPLWMRKKRGRKMRRRRKATRRARMEATKMEKDDEVGGREGEEGRGGGE